MFKGRSLKELAIELERQANTKRDFKAPTNQLTLSVKSEQINPNQPRPTPELQFSVGDKFTGGVTEIMHDQLGGYTKIPATYYDRMRKGDRNDQAMLAANVNHWLRKEPETRLVRTLDGRARAFLSNRYRMLDNFDVANSVLPVLINESQKLGAIEVVSSEVTDNRLYIKVRSNRLTYEVKKGDVVSLGINISNSEVGQGSVRVEPFLDRKICDNGAIIEELANRKYHVGRLDSELVAAYEVYRDETRKADDKAFMMKLQDTVRAAFDDERFAKLKGITVDATTRKIKAPIQDVVEEVASKFGLAEAHKDSFLKNLIEGGDTTQWGVANAITAIANTADNYEQATRLEKIGGEIIMLDGNQWRELADAA